jgi:hypothetical protein
MEYFTRDRFIHISIWDFFCSPYISIILDPVLGFLFGAALSIMIFQQDKSHHRLVVLVPLAVLFIVKESGIIFGAVIGGIFLLRRLCEYEWRKPALIRQLGNFDFYTLVIF